MVPPRARKQPQARLSPPQPLLRFPSLGVKIGKKGGTKYKIPGVGIPSLP